MTLRTIFLSIVLGIIISIPFLGQAQTSTIKYYDSYGRRIGSARIESETPIGPSFKGSPYVSGVPLELVERTAAIRQARFDNNVRIIQDRLNEVNALVEDFSDNQHLYSIASRKLNKLVNYINTCALDFSITSNLNLVLNKIYNVAEEIYTLDEYEISPVVQKRNPVLTSENTILENKKYIHTVLY